MLSCQTSFSNYPFIFDCDFVRFYFGKDLKYKVNYQEFTHLLQVCYQTFSFKSIFQLNILIINTVNIWLIYIFFFLASQ